ncbi:alpha/beta hydrolase [Hydrogenovibrio kuenenii]|uniref:alpha/beta hydrolase n=1 Tax=Hydrogenovibrio kuenenii TaxID=63658 RepID=UPI0004633B2A|nr:alpha/beta fold hydrolase [Hydrogenovibrio kuenenii]
MLNTYSDTVAPIVVEVGSKAPEACVIWLHGLGADGHDFEGVLPQLDLPEEAAIRFVFPTAPVQPVTVNMGSPMTAWYDISHPNLLIETDWQGIEQSVASVHRMIDEQLAKGIPHEKILLAGFSQGGVVALYAALTFPARLAGVMALSTYFPDPKDGPDVLQYKNANTLPVFYAHGEVDPICPLSAAEASRKTLEELGLDVEWNTYPMAHQVCYEELRQLSLFLRKVVI